MSKNSFFKKKKDGKEKRPFFTPKVEDDVEDKLNKMLDEEKKKDSKVKTNDENQQMKKTSDSSIIKTSGRVIVTNKDEKIDLVTGDVFTDFDYDFRESALKKSSTVKTYKSEEKDKKSIFSKKEPIVSKLPKRPIKTDITIVCIELSYSLEEIKKLLNATKMNIDTQFFKIVFFSNTIYSTEIIFSYDFSIEKIMDFVIKKKESVDMLQSSNVLMYDAIDEAMSLYKEKEFVNERNIKFQFDEFVIKNRKYLFITSGQDIGSSITKLELQKQLMLLRQEDTNVQVILTNIENLPKVSCLGFRQIRTIKL